MRLLKLIVIMNFQQPLVFLKFIRTLLARALVIIALAKSFGYAGIFFANPVTWIFAA